ncbi:hypothetical protein HGRIS_014467 [Hohenbuehelia grisea]|uniref:Uncharacterized protein n=1 Tax=Hohenbuehelia grisea TaxID=104357 RepID=A0ABR3JTS6_9AGAR
MDTSRALALSVFASYFLIILALFSSIVSGITTTRRVVSGGKTLTFVGLALASFAHTWLYMFKFLAWSFHEFEHSNAVAAGSILERTSNWLLNTGLFEQAWTAVCRKPINWWWSEQLCLFTVGAWTIFLAVEGRRHQVKNLWAYMLLGQLVAISVASNLFYVALLMSPTQRPTQRQAVSQTWTVLTMSVVLALATVALSPLTSENTFLWNLLTMHSIILLPLIRLPILERRPSEIGVSIKSLYTLVLVASLAIRSRTILNTAAATQEQSPFGLLAQAWSTLHSHPAQASIGWDVIWTSISFIAWVSLRDAGEAAVAKREDVPYLMLTTPLVSVGLTAPYILREDGPSAEGEVKKE